MAKQIPLRQCVGCREFKDKKELIRVVRTPENTFELDTTGKKNGRGAYICKNPQCLALAEKNKGLERSFKTNLSKEIYANLTKEFDVIEE